MKRLFCLAAIALVLCAPALSHHAAEGFTDEEVYEMIEALIADTPHASWTPPVDMGGGLTSMTISTPTVRPFESMIDDGLLTYLAMLDGEVVVTMTFNRRGGVDLLVDQLEVEP